MNQSDREPVRLVATTVHGRVHLAPPRDAAPPLRWLVGFHGYAQNAAIMLDSLRRVPGSKDWLLASVQALHPFYDRADQVVANWMTRQDREHAILDNIAYVDAVVADLERLYGAARALVFAGFSQGVAMAYRAGVAGRRGADAILAVAGDLPPELRTPGRRWPVVRIVVGTRETWYTPPRLKSDLEFLSSAGVDVASVTFDGGHVWSPEVDAAAADLLAEVAART